RVQEAAANSGGTGRPATSPQTQLVIDPPPPVNTAPPGVYGPADQGHTLSVSHGGWTNNPLTYGYRWEACDSSGSNCTTIPGATGQTYALTSSDIGHTIRVQETASNSGGSSNAATSGPFGPVHSAPSASTPSPAVQGS